MNVFISYNRQNSIFVNSVTQRLRGDISIIKELFFDQENLEGGQVWTEEIQNALTSCDACIVFIGEQGIGSWQNKEVLSAVNRYVDSKGAFKLIPVIIPHSKSEPVQKNFPWFLADMQWIEFLNETDPDAFQKLTSFLTEGELLITPDATMVPYKGLDFFDVRDAPFFFGRTFDLNWIFYKKLTLEIKSSNRFLAVVGDSGSGKSSFTRAGILATIKAGRFPGSETWKQLAFSPEDNPLLKLSAALQSAGVITDAAKMESDAKGDPATLRRILEVYGKKIVMLVDQFEEVLTQCKDNQLRESFLKNITEALKCQHFVCIVTMRSDFYASFSPFREFADMMEANNYTITSLDFNTGGDEWERYLRDIIQKPAKLLGVQFDSVLTNQILEDCKSINGILPALQLALVELWKKRKDEKKIQSSDYDGLAKGKGIAGIIEEHANNTWKSITKDETDKKSADLIKAIFIRLVEITGNKEDVRKTVSKSSLINDLSAQFKQSEIEETLNMLSGISVRLIRVKSSRSGSNEAWVEVIHEALIRQWALLRKWLNERREAITYRNKLEQYIDDDNTLYTGKKLAAAERWISTNGDLTTKKINEFVRRCRANVNKRNLIAGITLATLLVMAVAIWLYKPVYECNNCALVKKVEAGNNEVDDIHTLVVNGTADIEFMRCFTNLDTLVWNSAAGENFLSQQSLDKLPGRLKFITINGFALSDTLLSFNRFAGLKMLSLAAIPNLHSVGIGRLDSLQALKLADLENFTGFSETGDLKRLQSLQLIGLTRWNGVATLKNLPGLRWLQLSRTPLTSLEQIEGLVGLQHLILDNLSIPNLAGVDKLRELRSLSLSRLARVSTLAGIESCKSLEALNLTLHLDSVTQLESLTNLQSLTLEELRNSDLSALRGLGKLRSLSLKQLLVASLSGIENLKELESLRLENMVITRVAEIKSLRRLRLLHLEGLAGIASLNGIEDLLLQDLTVSNLENLSTLSGIESLKGLQYLKLSELPVTDLNGIEQLDNLRTLSIDGLRSVTSIAPIANCNKLRELNLAFVSSVKTIGEIKALQNLERLSVVNLEIDLTGIEELKQLKDLRLTNLRVQDISFLNRAKVGSLRLSGIQGLSKQPLPTLKNNNVSDTLSLSAMTMTDLDFIDQSLAVKAVQYDGDIELPGKEAAFKARAAKMKRTKFADLGLSRVME